MNHRSTTIRPSTFDIDINKTVSSMIVDILKILSCSECGKDIIVLSDSDIHVKCDCLTEEKISSFSCQNQSDFSEKFKH